jgi:hypothetical protein
MSENMPNKRLEDMPEKILERMLEDVLNSMLENISDRMLKDMLDMRDRWGGREKMMLLFGVLRPGCVFRYFFPDLWSM